MAIKVRLSKALTWLMVGFAVSPLYADEGGWPQYGGEPGGGRYSPLAQINRDNVSELELAWSYRTGAQDRYPELIALSGYQATPILLPPEAGGHLVTCTPFNRVIALNPVNGEERWVLYLQSNTMC